MNALSNVEIRREVEYAVHDGVSLRGDLYLPATPGPHGAIIAVHGGGWQSGSPSTYRHWGPWLAARGFALFAIRYRLSSPGKPTYPQAVHDLIAAIQFLRGEGEALRIDGDRIGLMGGSAGGQLTALVALAGHEAPFANAYPQDRYAHFSSQVRAVAPFYGVFDMQQQWTHDMNCRPYDNITEKFMGFPAPENRRAYIEASPITYAERPRNGTPFLIVTGDEDDVVDRSQSDAFLLALRQAQFYARRIVVPGAGHFFEADPLDEPASRSGQTAGPLLRFFEEMLAPR